MTSRRRKQQPTFRDIPASVVEAGAIVPGLAGDVPGGGVVPADSGTEISEVGPVIPVVAGGMVETTESVDSNGVVTGNKNTCCNRKRSNALHIIIKEF